MVRLACISFPRIDLQILALRHNEWKQIPAAVVTEEKPLGRITEANRAARAAGVQPGMRYASALSVCPELRAGVVQPEERQSLRETVVGRLRAFTPEIEPSISDNALFWVDAGGLNRLYPSLAKWAGAMQNSLETDGLVCSVAVGFTRFGTYAAAKRKRTITIFEHEDQEEAAAMRSPVGVLPLEHDLLLRLHQLGLYTIRDFVRFSPGALRRRFGREVESLQRFARGESSLPVQGESEHDPLRREMRLLYPEADAEPLLNHQLTLLRSLIETVFGRRQLITEITLELYPELWPGKMEPGIVERIRTARPTLDAQRIERLVKLRLESVELPAPIIRLAVEVGTVPTERGQADLFSGSNRRDPHAALSAIADICAEFGNDAVQVAQLEDAHLPEEMFSWQRVDSLMVPLPKVDSGSALIRRMLRVPASARRVDLSHGCYSGPYEISGGWWNTRFNRRYYYAEKNGRMSWIYFDVGSSTWFTQGVVE
jgi:protein ImuB